jgi:hypothetical protein
MCGVSEFQFEFLIEGRGVDKFFKTLAKLASS